MNLAVSGLRAWIVQRVSALYLAGFLLYVAAHFLLDPPRSYWQWERWMHGPVTSVAWAVFFVALLLHAWVGIRDIVMDYVHPLAARFLALSLVGSLLILMGLWALRVVELT